VVVLGGMALHNAVILVYDLRRHWRHQQGKPAVRRMTRNEIYQHAVLLLSFSVLAVSGFALRFHDAWWVGFLTELGFSEELRRLVHRAMAVLLVAGSTWHGVYLIVSRRGRMLGRALVPGLADVRDFFAAMAHALHLRPEPPTFGAFDYTQKAEYWALVWGTAVMTLTGLVLWFPTVATSWMPAWTVRVSEVIHFYEAILAVSAIIIWHFFFVVFKPGVYPMSWIWIDGRMPLDEYRHHHGRADAELGEAAEVLPGKPTGDD
jgi:cytochrome b subunit of formate dehydrogenase